MSGAGIRVERGSGRDLEALARHHYARGRPAPAVLVLRAVEEASGEVVGVLGVSMPALNGGWRAEAWPGVFAGLGRREAARVLNERVRTISRVIVEPRRRAIGVGALLVRAYLRERLTEFTEAIAAMGRWVPLFKRSGMRRVAPVRALRDWRLLDALDAAGLCVMDLADEERAREVMRVAFVREEVDRWLNGARGTRDVRGRSRVARARVAARALLAPPQVFVHGEG